MNAPIIVPYSDVMCMPGTRPSGGVCSGGIICKSFGIQRRNYYRLIAASVCIQHAYIRTRTRHSTFIASIKRRRCQRGGNGVPEGLEKTNYFPFDPR